jgi:probable 2-oxoglutarate dehydrogenase E1 component DHKTD1
LTTEEAEHMRAEHKALLESQLSAAETWAPVTPMLQEAWSQCVWPASSAAVRDPPTGVSVDALKQVGRASVAVPDDFVGLVDIRC